tara:strand:+ start:1518 stop:1721 length:204 start_codon:yes stop_codon:yes gene_type:complete
MPIKKKPWITEREMAAFEKPPFKPSVKCNDCDNWANRIVAFIKFDPVKVCDDCYFKYYQKFVKRTYR